MASGNVVCFFVFLFLKNVIGPQNRDLCRERLFYGANTFLFFRGSKVSVDNLIIGAIYTMEDLVGHTHPEIALEPDLYPFDQFCN